MTLLDAFTSLCSVFKDNLYHPFNIVRGWYKQYCDEHWHNENLDWNVSSMMDLYKMLERSSYHNAINPGLLKFIANKSKNIYLIGSVKNYEKKFSCKKFRDLDFIREIIVNGSKESTSIVSTLRNEVTIGQLWSVCSPRLVNASTLILDVSEPLLELYYSFKVRIYIYMQ